MTHELTQRFFFEAAHTLQREVDTERSRRLHGHTYHAEVAVRGTPAPATGMLIDIAVLRRHIDAVRERLDHHLLDDVAGLAQPTLESLCDFIAAALGPQVGGLARVRVWREASGDGCTLTL
jgi:6-pyruvoyltetrahydropterin/6-carboxytetrahydropterin synthase